MPCAEKRPFSETLSVCFFPLDGILSQKSSEATTTRGSSCWTDFVEERYLGVGLIRGQLICEVSLFRALVKTTPAGDFEVRRHPIAFERRFEKKGARRLFFRRWVSALLRLWELGLRCVCLRSVPLKSSSAKHRRSER